ncbi:MAG: FG-GAP repeat protein, partial [Gemmatimonadetes bacterium]|nr:FG-GAP repeat protein [Gemmatimonadota bacterium]
MTLPRLLIALLAVTAYSLPATAQSSSFGNTVVVDGTSLVVGEPNNSFRPGMVYVYRKQDSGWVEVDRLRAPDAERADGFGAVLAMSGTTLFVGQRGGAVHAFERDGGTWSHSETLAQGDREGLDPRCNAYGYCGTDFGMALAAGGDWLLVGEARAPTDMSRLRPRRRRGDEDVPPPPPGSVYAFQRTA